MKKCVFAGTFDPFTAGHADTVGKSLKLFDEVVVAVGDNPAKTCMFSAEDRIAMIRAAYRDEPRVRAVLWGGAIVDLLKAEGTPFYVRGVRNSTDFEYETADFFASRKLDGDMVTVYIPTEQELLHVSSTIVRNSIVFGKPWKDYVPEAVYEYITRKQNHV